MIKNRNTSAPKFLWIFCFVALIFLPVVQLCKTSTPTTPQEQPSTETATESDNFDDYYYGDAIDDTHSLWTLDSTTGTVEIPYMIDTNIYDGIRPEIQKAIDELHYKTCIRLTETPNIPNEDYIFFKASGACLSPVGKKPNTKKHSIRVGGCQSFGRVLHEVMHMLGFYHEQTRRDRDDFVNIDFEEIKRFEKARYGNIKNTERRNYIRCNETKIAENKGCQSIGAYDGNSIMHYPPTRTVQVIENGSYVNKTFRVLTLKPEAHALCKGGRCNPGQRNGLSVNDVSDIATLYKTTCATCADGIRNQGELGIDCGGPCHACPPDNLVIIGGRNRGYLFDIEAVSLEDNNINCDPTDLPYKVYGPASVYSPVLDGILTCGGVDENGNYLSKCILQRKGNESNHFPPLNSKRYGLSLTTISNAIYAIGGSPNRNTMEIINLNTDKQWKQEELPFSVSGHCSVGLGNKIIVTGGWDENYDELDTTWIYDLLFKTWSEGPKMKTKRYGHVCFQNTESSSIYIAGGEDDQGNRLSSTEKWTFEENSWKPSANLPEAISWSSAVSSNKDEYIGYMAGGYNGYQYSSIYIYGLTRRQMEWIKLNKTMKIGRSGHSLLNIPANQILGC